MVVSLLLCIGGGVLLDRWLGTSPVMVLIGMVAGLIAAGYSLYELAVLGEPDKGLVKLRRHSARGSGEPQQDSDEAMG